MEYINQIVLILRREHSSKKFAPHSRGKIILCHPSDMQFILFIIELLKEQRMLVIDDFNCQTNIPSWPSMEKNLCVGASKNYGGRALSS